jgi:hypothetical protein
MSTEDDGYMLLFSFSPNKFSATGGCEEGKIDSKANS